MRRYARGGFSGSFGVVSTAERRQADLFLSDLLGVGSRGQPFLPVKFRAMEENWIPEPSLPPRGAGAPGGAAFMKTIWGEGSPPDWVKREEAMAAALLAGNMPSWLRRWVTIEVQESSPNVKVRVLPDYLCVGDDTDYRHVPLDQHSAQRVADAFSACLPTAKICHAIWRQTPATHRIGAIQRDYFIKPWTKRTIIKEKWGQTSTAAYDEHSRAIQAKMGGAAPPIAPGQLVAGHKKDVVLAAGLHKQPTKIAFHGFYDPKGFPFEPCYEVKGGPLPGCNKEVPTLAHPEGRFSDYSQGVRLVHPIMHIDGAMKLVKEVLRDKDLSKLISTEGAIDPPRIPKFKNPRAREAQGESAAGGCRCGCRGEST